VAAYYNTVKRADDSIGRMMDAIADSGATNNTIIIVISDHGAEFPCAKTQLYHHSSVSPMFVYWPGITSSNTINDTHMINSIDFVPSFCELIGQPIPTDIDGKSFIPIIKGEDPSDWREYIYKEHSVGHNMRAVQTTNMLYIFNPWSNGSRKPNTVTKGHKCFEAIEIAAASGTNAAATVWLEQFEHRTVEELYDITTDPDCKINLFTNATYAAELAAMQSLLQQEMLASGDLEILGAFTNRASQVALDQYMNDDQAMRNEMKETAEHTRDVFFNPHDDWEKLDYTIFEPSGNWGIWEAEGSGINHNSSNGDAKAGDNCIEFNGSVADVSRLVVSNALDTSVFEQLKLDVAISDNAAFGSGASLSFQYNDGNGWQTFQTISSAGKKNLTFELPGGGLPSAMYFGIQADFNGSGGSIYMDHARLTAWQDWINAPTNTPFNASDLGHIRLTFDFETQNFFTTDKLLLEYYNGSAWDSLKEYAFDYVLQTNQNYSDMVELYPSTHTFPTNMEFRLRSESTGSGQTFTINNMEIETRLASEDVTISVPPTANPDNYSATDPQAIVIASPGILDNDVSGTGSNLTATLITGVASGILEFNPDGSFVYAATNGYTGADWFSYVAYDGNAFSATATVSLVIYEPSLDPVIFFDDFESGSIATKGWDQVNADQYMSSEAYNGTYKANIRRGGYISKTVSTENYSDIQLDYARIWKEGDAFNPAEMLTVEWSSNGTDWIEIETYQSGSWASNSVALPAANNLPAFTLRFDVTSNLWKEKAYIDDVRITGTPTAGSSVITNFSDWVATHGVATNNEHVLDYAFNINPHLSERYLLSGGGNSGIPTWDIVATTNKLVVEYIRRKQAADLTYKVQFTNSLTTNWIDAVSSGTITPVDDDFERVSVPDDVTTASSTNRFGRVIVISN
jgi:hypothetical protein